MNPYRSRHCFDLCFPPFCAVALSILVAAPSSRAQSPIKYEREILMVGSKGIVDRGRLVGLEQGLTARRIVVGLGVVDGGTAGDGEEVVYRNFDGPLVYPLLPNEWIADDLATICASSSLTRLVLPVTGGGQGAGPGFDIEVQLYSGCPSQNGVPISGTHFAVNLPDDGLFTVEYNLSNAPVPIGREVWLAIRSSSDHAGWLFGGEPDIGYSEDRVDASPFGCSTSFGGCPPRGPACANGTATLYAVDCVPEFVAYRADTSSSFFLPMDSAEVFADDILPITAPGLCSLTCYAPSVAGLGGPFSIATQIWSNDEVEQRPLVPVPGTACELSDGCCFNPPIEVPTARFWLTYDLLNGSDAGPTLVGDHPSIGYSEDCFAILGDPDPEYWSACVWWFGGCPLQGDAPCGTFRNTVYCAGTEPRGACCGLDPENEYHCVDEVAYSQCPGRFIADSTCEEGLFDPPCGAAACCLHNGNCDNIPAVDCEILGGLWQPGDFCEVDTQQCPPESCGQSPLPCCEPRPTPGPPGCNDPLCCAIVCGIDVFCCQIGWDDICADLACDLCEDKPTCPPGPVSFVNPPSGVVDARQPNPINEPAPLQGIEVLTVSAPVGADDGCFSMCETAGSGSANSIESVIDNGTRTYTVTLARRITPFAITRLAYQPNSGPATIGTFISHPANVNGDSVAGPTDILAIIDCLNGVNLNLNCPWGIYSTDIDHSGVLNPADILRVIDMLNGVDLCDWPPCPPPGPNPLPMGTCMP